MKILVTGSDGFVGKAFYEIAGLENRIIRYDLPEHDILDIKDMASHIEHCDIVVHMAAVADLYKSAEDPDSNFYVNVEGTYYVGKLCAQYNKPLIFISTCCVYGDTGHTEDTEETVPKTIEQYACSKVAGEYILRGTPDLDYCILRIGTVYGPDMRPALFNHIALDRVSKEQIVYVYGDGEQTRNYVYIYDLVDGIYKSIIYFDSIKGETINICGHQQISVNGTIRAAEDITGKTAKVKHETERYGEIHSENISSQKAKELINWCSNTDYYDGMRVSYRHM